MSLGSALISRAAAARARSYSREANAASTSQGWPLRATPIRPAYGLASGSGLHEAALRKQISRGISNNKRWDGSMLLFGTAGWTRTTDLLIHSHKAGGSADVRTGSRRVIE